MIFDFFLYNIIKLLKLVNHNIIIMTKLWIT